MSKYIAEQLELFPASVAVLTEEPVALENNNDDYAPFDWSDELTNAVLAKAPPLYYADFNMHDTRCVMTAVNQGIDSYLEACNVPTRGDSYIWNNQKLNSRISRESMPILLRRLSESTSPRAVFLAIDILDTIGIDPYTT